MDRAPKSHRGLLALLLATICTFAPGCSDSETEQALLALARATSIGSGRQSYRGVREVWYLENGTLQRHVEAVFDDGGEDVGLDLLDDGSGAPSPTARLMFLLEGRFLHTFRDLALGDVALLLENYRVRLVPGEETILGHPALHLEFTKRASGQKAVEVWSDRVSGLPLRVDRFGELGDLVFRMEYRSIEIGAVARTPEDPSSLPQAPPEHDRSAASPETGEAALAILAPTWIPAGFRPAAWRDVEIDLGTSKTVARWSRFTDGLEHVFVIQGDAMSGAWDLPAATSSLDREIVLASYQLGAVNVVAATKDVHAIVAFGRVSANDLGGMVAGYLR